MSADRLLKDALSMSLRQLVEVLKQRQLTLIEVAGKTEDKAIALLCYQVATDRARLERQVMSLLPGTLDEGSPPAALPIQEIDRSLLAAVNAGDTYSMLSEIVRGEDVILDLYRRAIFYCTDLIANNLLREQYESVQASRETVRRLRDAATPEYSGWTRSENTESGPTDH